jgi:hypothetical protein
MFLSSTILILFEYIYKSMSSSTRRQQQERDDEYSSNTQQQREATIRSIDETKDSIRRSIEEIRKEAPAYSQTVTDFQNETADASVEIADNFLESQKEVIKLMQSAWAPTAERIGQVAHYWTTTGMMPFFFPPREMANIYARTIGAMTEAYVAYTRMTTNMLFAGIEATRATTNYTRQNAKEAARITSNTAKAFAQTAKETGQVEGEERESNSGDRSSVHARAGSAASSFESRGADTTSTTTTATFAREGTTVASSSGQVGSTATTAGPGASTETNTDTTEKTRSKMK